MGITLNNYLNKFEEFKSLPAGESFTIRVSDQEATAVAREYLTERKDSVKQMIQKRVGMGLTVEDPTVKFREDEIFASATGGKGFLKAKASLTAEVRWDEKLIVAVRSVTIPFLPVSPEKLNSIVEGPLKKAMGMVEQYAEIRSFKVTDGFAVLEAVRKKKNLIPRNQG